jgi:hypothetical protein
LAFRLYLLRHLLRERRPLRPLGPLRPLCRRDSHADISLASGLPTRLTEDLSGTTIVLVVFDFEEGAPNPSLFNIPPYCVAEAPEPPKAGRGGDVAERAVEAVRRRFERIRAVVEMELE